MTSFYGKVLRYSDKYKETSDYEFAKKLPGRNLFIDKKIQQKTLQQISNCEPLLFLPNDIRECNEKIGQDGEENDEGFLKYRINMFGILRDGSKAQVIITDICVYIDILVNENPEHEYEKIVEILKKNEKPVYLGKWKNANGNFIDHEVKKLKPFIGFSESRKKFLRLYFNTSFYRRSAITILTDHGYKTFEDDRNNHPNKVFREYKILPCGWNTITSYKLQKGNNMVKYVLLTGVQNIHEAKFDPTLAENDDLIKDKSIVMTWDIETFSEHPTGNPPSPENVFWTDGTLNDKIVALSSTFHYTFQKNDFLRVAITTLPAPARDDCLIIQCDNQFELIKIFALLINRMAPDFLTGFNDGLYDWPFILQRVELKDRNILSAKLGGDPNLSRYQALIMYNKRTNYANNLKKKSTFVKSRSENDKMIFRRDENPKRQEWLDCYRKMERDQVVFGYPLLTNFIKRTCSCLNATIQNMMYMIPFQNIEEIKISAEDKRIIYNVNMPGMICFDTRTVFQQLHAGSSESSLNFFLRANNLGSKEDMSAPTMFKICRAVSELKKRIYTDKVDVFENKYEDYVEYLHKIIKKKGENYKIFPELTGSGDYKLNNLSAIDILHLIAGPLDGGKPNEGISQLINYCNIDAKRCQELNQQRNVIIDRRELGNKTFTCMYDNFYRAGGMKVRNKVIASSVPDWNIAFSTCSKTHVKDSRKYPGAYVLTPIKGLYRDDMLVKIYRQSDYIESANLIVNSLIEDKADEKKKEFSDIEKKDKKLENSLLFAKSHPLSGNFDNNLLTLLRKFDKELQVNLKKQDLVSEFANKRASLRIVPENYLKNDRPCTGLDYSSLYPSLIMTYNISPEKIVTDPSQAKNLRDKGYNLLKISFKYCDPGEEITDRNQNMIKGWIVQHDHPARKIIQNEVERAKKIASKKNMTNTYDWIQFIENSVIDGARKEMLDTPLEDWKQYGMGLYPYVLKQLFDERRQVKKSMEKFESSGELLSNFIHSDANIKSLSIQEQQNKLVLYVKKKCAELMSEFKQKGEKYFADQASRIEETKNFLLKAWTEGVYKDRDLSQLIEEIDFSFRYFNSKQLALKVFMNTFYGETGNTISPFFAVLVAGAITTMGQKNLKMVVDFARSGGYPVLYGDTDSAYVCGNENDFIEIDKLYFAGKITKVEYWTRMVKTTMTSIDKLKGSVNNLLLMTNGTTFLNMAYEEVLWPFVLLGKKKYAGIKHMGMVNSNPWLPECSMADFKKAMFIRGLDLKKRHTSAMLKQVCFELFKEIFCIESIKTLKTVVENKLETLSSQKWDLSLFIKNAKYKLPVPGTQGNKAVLSFVERMEKLKSEHPNLSIRNLDAGERFEYVIVQRYPWKYDIKGRKTDVKIGDRYEYPEMIGNADYEEVLGEKLEIDVDYYIKNEIMGQFARFVVYHPAYDKISSSAMTDEEFNEADDEAWTFAKKSLETYYTENFAKKYKSHGAFYKKIYKQVKGVASASIDEQCNGASIIYQSVDKHLEQEELDLKVILNGVINAAEKIGNSSVRIVNIKKLAEKLDKSTTELAQITVGKNGYLSKYLFYLEKKIYKVRNILEKNLPGYIKSCGKTAENIAKNVNKIRSVYKPNDLAIIDNNLSVFNQNISDQIEFIETFKLLAALFAKKIEAKKLIDNINFVISGKGKSTFIPVHENMECKKNFTKFIHEKMIKDDLKRNIIVGNDIDDYLDFMKKKCDAAIKNQNKRVQY